MVGKRNKKVVLDVVDDEKVLYPLVEMKQHFLEYSADELLVLSIDLIGDAARYGEDKRSMTALQILSILRKHSNLVRFLEIFKCYINLVRQRHEYVMSKRYNIYKCDGVFGYNNETDESKKSDTEKINEDNDTSTIDHQQIAEEIKDTYIESEESEKNIVEIGKEDAEKASLDVRTSKTQLMEDERAFEIFHTNQATVAMHSMHQVKQFLSVCESIVDDEVSEESIVIEKQINSDEKSIKEQLDFAESLIKLVEETIETHPEICGHTDTSTFIFNTHGKQPDRHNGVLLPNLHNIEEFPYDSFHKSMFENIFPTYNTSLCTVLGLNTEEVEVPVEKKEDIKIDIGKILYTDKKKVEKIIPKKYDLEFTMRSLCSPIEVTLYMAVLFTHIIYDSSNNDRSMTFVNYLLNNIKNILEKYPKICIGIDSILAKCLSLYALSCEKYQPLEEIRPTIMEMLELSQHALAKGVQAVSINCLLRNYVLCKEFEPAYALLIEVDYPESYRSIAQHSRYCYYAGFVYAARLDYRTAYSKFSQCIRQAPKQSAIKTLENKAEKLEKKEADARGDSTGRLSIGSTSHLKLAFKHDGAPGFYVAALKACVVVSLLLGEIPDRKLVNDTSLRKRHRPYEYLIHTVFKGDMQYFDLLINKYKDIYQRDNLYFLVQRLYQSVVRSALKLLLHAYSRIPLADVALKIGAKNEDAAESILMKAIRDGTISAKLDQQCKHVVALPTTDVYSTLTPYLKFKERTSFLLKVEEEAGQALYK